jgi:purine nucleoside phosphorylase
MAAAFAARFAAGAGVVVLVGSDAPGLDAALMRRTAAACACAHLLTHVARHGRGHERLSHQVEHRANVWALHALGVGAEVGWRLSGRARRPESGGSARRA